MEFDMNEASSFCDGECPGFYSTPEEYMDLPYIPGNHSLEDQVLPLLSSMVGPYSLQYACGEVPAAAFRAVQLPSWGFHWLNWSLWQQMRESMCVQFPVVRSGTSGCRYLRLPS